MGKKKEQPDQDESFVVAPAAKATSKVMGPLDVQQKEFRVSRFGGYKMRDVDEFLDHITDSMSAMAAENDRLRKGAPTSSIVGTPDLADVSRQADEIIQRARAEAARIVTEARSQAAGTAAGPQDRAAVSAFLAREREFLQSLAGLVQGHAEQVKDMAKSGKTVKPSAPEAAAAARLSAAPAAPAPPAPKPVPKKVEATQADAAVPAPPKPEQAQRPPAAKPEPTPQEKSRPEPTVRIEDPEPASVGRSDADPDAPGDGDRSLRDLFWGED